jgi:hypothetical protein
LPDDFGLESCSRSELLFEDFSELFGGSVGTGVGGCGVGGTVGGGTYAGSSAAWTGGRGEAGAGSGSWEPPVALALFLLDELPLSAGFGVGGGGGGAARGAAATTTGGT